MLRFTATFVALAISCQTITNALELTSCGAYGHAGPSEVQCRDAYEDYINQALTGVDGGIQQIAIPETGTYLVQAYGAGGGPGRRDPESYLPSRGAASWGYFHFTNTTKLSVVVGQPGIYYSEYTGGSHGGGGGGGSFVWLTDDDETPLVVAGGGGGASYYSTSSTYWGYPGVATENGFGARSGGAGGVGGQGGGRAPSCSDTHGGAGGGWKSDGDCSNCNDQLKRRCGRGKVGSFLGGVPENRGYFEGGFGGGGGSQHEGGGGGGYSGGGGGYSRSFGGGGGSFVHPTLAFHSGKEQGGSPSMQGLVRIVKVWDNLPSNRMVLSTCGALGWQGPSDAKCKAMYEDNMATDPNGMYQTTTNGIQEISIPKGVYRMTAFGAKGGGAQAHSERYRPGLGAKASGVFKFDEITTLKVVVGQNGNFQDDASFQSTTGGGGGGGTFVWIEGGTSPLVVAGGGGGASYGSPDPLYWGKPGRSEVDGGDATPTGGKGGKLGSGGFTHSTCSANMGAPGAGWRSDAVCSCSQQMCGKSIDSNFIGGKEYGTGYYQGGFGGGGGTRYQGGGGGGYSGGGGGYNSHGAGGGGGSYVDSPIRELVEGGNMEFADGLVIIEELEDDELSSVAEPQLEKYLFSSCGKQGRQGPSNTECTSAYQGTKAGDMYVTTDAGIQEVKVPQTGYWRITAHGAQGGHGQNNNYNYRGGSGAKAWSTILLEKDTAIKIVVGQPGNTRPNSGGSSYGGGGGGGSFVWKKGEDEPLVVAGGGGGGTYGNIDQAYFGRAGRASLDGSAAAIYGGEGGKGGSGGLGPNDCSSGNGGGGGGWHSSGDCRGCYDHMCGHGKDELFVGGQQRTTGYWEGGFGGGAGCQHQGGGGGGYSGGGGGQHSSHGGGGGGGSYTSGYDAGWIEGGEGALYGYVLFEFVSAEMPAPGITLTPCYARGNRGPSEAQCQKFYANGGDPQGMLAGVRAGIQAIEIPQTGAWKITAGGARGGNGKGSVETDYTGGQGAEAWGTFTLQKGDMVNVIVGQNGFYVPLSESTTSLGGGGGGGSFVWTAGETEPMIVAGGGGGGSYGSTAYKGKPGAASTCGSKGDGNGGVGGCDGLGGSRISNSDGSGGGGGGWKGNGICSDYYPYYCGNGFSAGLSGGVNRNHGYPYGGFGGGGGTQHQGAGGGGYSGGSGGTHSHGSGGGGGSYKSGRNNGWSEGSNSQSDGYVRFEFVGIEGSTDVALPTTGPKYEAASWELTSCGVAGRSGPSKEQCDTSYSQVDASLVFQGIDAAEQFQKIKVPRTDYYRITAAGARGGRAQNSNSYPGGYAAEVSGVFLLESEETIAVVVGQEHNRPTSGGSSWGGGGGGGSFVFRPSDDLPLLVGGGGGGASYASTDVNYHGRPANLLTYGGDAYYGGGFGGFGGHGGTDPISRSTGNGGGGGGWRTSGLCLGYTSICGHGRDGAFQGGAAYNRGYYDGGFGGGAATGNEGGGGGGYSGGGGGLASHGSGGGGGSYFHRSAIQTSGSVTNFGPGYVRFELMCPIVGTTFDPVNMICVDIDACINHPCVAGTTTLECEDLAAPAADSPAGRTCVCSDGFEFKDDDCAEIDACINNACPVNSECVDKDPPALDNEEGRSCTCNAGFVFDGQECVDVDACSGNPCGMNEKCDDLAAPAPNTAAGRTCTCMDGFKKLGTSEGSTCVDIDACDNNPCPANSDCTDSPAPAGDDAAGRTCACREGYELNSNGACVDIDACVTTPCGFSDAVCTDLPPPKNGSASGRTCACPTGLDGTGDSCSDINACNTSPCHEDATCVDKPKPALGDPIGRTCTCKAGFEGDGDTCTDINACLANPCDQHATCTDLVAPAPNTANGRRCECNQGYVGDGSTCTEIDACLNTAIPDCSLIDANSECVDLPAPAVDDEDGRACACKTGFSRLVAGGICDIDACQAKPCGAADFTVCTDKEGAPPGGDLTSGRTCECAAGYEGDAEVACFPIDACTNHPCPSSATQATCIDLPAPAPDSASGRTWTCSAGFEKVDEIDCGCVDIDACESYSCAVNAVCFDREAPAANDANGRTCECESGFEGDGENDCEPDACTFSPCPVEAVCQDKKGPQFGQGPDGRTCTCPLGYQEGNGTCVDVDACIDFPCPSSVATCVDLSAEFNAPNSADGRLCRCPEGYHEKADGGCDLDACQTSPCSPFASCVDLEFRGGDENGRTCACNPGYEGDGMNCTNIDACVHFGCDANAVCRDLLPPAGDGVDGRICQCKAGYTGNGELCIETAISTVAGGGDATTAAPIVINVQTAESASSDASSDASKGTGTDTTSGGNNDTLMMVVIIAIAVLIAVIVIVVLVNNRKNKQTQYQKLGPLPPQPSSLSGRLNGQVASTLSNFDNPVFTRRAQAVENPLYADMDEPEETGGYLDVGPDQ